MILNERTLHNESNAITEEILRLISRDFDKNQRYKVVTDIVYKHAPEDIKLQIKRNRIVVIVYYKKIFNDSIYDAGKMKADAGNKNLRIKIEDRRLNATKIRHEVVHILDVINSFPSFNSTKEYDELFTRKSDEPMTKFDRDYKKFSDKQKQGFYKTDNRK